MALLSGPFHYDGTPADSPVDTATIDISTPIFSYMTAGEELHTITRAVMGWADVSVDIGITDSDYRAEISSGDIVGRDEEAARLFLAYTIQSAGNDATVIDNLTVQVRLRVVASNSTLSFHELDAIYLVRGLAQLTSQTKLRAIAAPTGTAYHDFLERNLFLINADVYQDVFNKVRNTAGSLQNLPMLYVVQRLLDLADVGPGNLPVFNDACHRELPEIVRDQQIEHPAEVAQLIEESFDGLFRFPIKMSAIISLTVAGKFHVDTADDSSITRDDLTYYTLSTQFSVLDATGRPQPRQLVIDWKQNHSPISENSIKFEFMTPSPILQNSVQGTVSVRLNGFDSSVLWESEYACDDPALTRLAIDVQANEPNILQAGTGIVATADASLKLRGKLVALDQSCPLKDAVIAVRAKVDADAPWRVVGAATADIAGNFTMDYPFGTYVAAQAVASLMPDSPVDIAVDSTSVNRSISDDFLYLLIDNPQCDGSTHHDGDDCTCKNEQRPARLPGQDDLIRSDDYTQDIGGSCVNLSTPNRTLREYSYQGIVRTSDPDVANYILNRVELPGDGVTVQFELLGGNQKIQRKPVDLDNPIRWQDAPEAHTNLSFYQAVTVATGHILHYRSEFRADGYSLGDLLYSLGLAPGQKKQMVVIDSAHSLQAAESQTLSQGERLAASIIDDRAITDQLSGSLDESLRGSSSASTSGVSAGLGIGASIGVVSGALGVAGGYANSNSSASQNSARNTSQYFGEKLRQAITQNADSYRQLNASVVSSVQENQHYSTTTDVVANHNHCHSLTMMYFEVLRHFAIFQELVDVEECVFVPLLMTNFTQDNIFKWRDALAKNLLPMPSNTYLRPFGFLFQHPLLKAFDANERIKTKYANVDYPAGPYDREPIQFIKGEIVLKTRLPRPKTRYDRIKTLPVTTKRVSHAEFDSATAAKSVAGAVLTGGISLLFGGGSTTRTVTEEVLANAAIFDAFLSLDANYEKVPPAQCIRVTNFQPTTVAADGGTFTVSGLNFFEGSVVDKKLWETYATLLGYSDVFAFLDYYFKGRLIAEWDDIYNNDIAPLLFEKLIDTLHLEEINADYSGASRYKGGEQQMRVRLNGTTTKARFLLPLYIKFFSNSTAFKSIKDSVTVDVGNVTILYSTAHYNGRLFSGYVGDDLLDDTTLYIPENSDEKRNPRNEDIFIVEKLIVHLNSNLEHYNKALWRDLDPDRRFMLIDGFNIQIFNDFGIPAGMRSLASVVKNQLIAIVGNSLVFPVAAGYKISQSYIAEQTQEGATAQVTLFDHYRPFTPVPPYRISIPSKGVFMEAVKGNCDACEKVEDNTSQDWTRFTTDEPTPINAVSPPVPTITDWRAAFKDFAPPLINIQNAPAAPAPGAGLAGLSELLGKSGIFNDITGLDANQQNVLKTYLSNQENAKAFAEMAKGLAAQSHNTQNSDKIMDTLKTAKDSGALTQQEYGKLVKDHIQQQIDGGDSNNAEQSAAQATKPTLTDAAVRAADQGKSVKAQKTDKDGVTESVDIKEGQTASVLAQVSGTVPNLKQDNEMACWATAATIMMSWKRSKTMTVLEALAEAGNKYVQLFKDKKGLPSSEKTAFITALKMVGEPPANYPAQQYVNWLKTYGPLWITTDSASGSGDFSPHARILTRITGNSGGDGSKINLDFMDPATGSIVTESFQDFINAFEQMVTDNQSGLFVQVVHFVEHTDAGEGAGAARDPRQVVNEFQPVNSDTIVANMHEYPFTVGGLTNFINWKTDPTAQHNKNWNRPARAVEKINQIAIHETGAEGDGAYMEPYTAHLAVYRNNTIRQFNDLIEMEYHISEFNEHSVGIEFANLSWVPRAPAKLQSLPAKYKDATKYLPVFWGSGRNVYTLPAVSQLEKLVDLITWLVSFNHPPNPQIALPKFDQVWLQNVSFDDVSALWDFPTEPATAEAKAAKNYFIMTTAHGYLTPANFLDTSGILSHATIARDAGYITSCDHGDGALPSLYAFLRIEKHKDSAGAYALIKTLMASKFVRVKTKTNIAQRDVDSSCNQKKDATGQPIVLGSTKREIVLIDVGGI